MKPTPAKPSNSIAHVDGFGTLPTPEGETSRSQRADIPRVSKTIYNIRPRWLPSGLLWSDWSKFLINIH
jgi:hypothetical protein